MVHKQNIKTSSFSWLSSSYKSIDSSMVSNFYEPDTIDELKSICVELNTQKKKFLVIGHTSNLYFTPTCTIDTVVSTRKLNNWELMGGEYYSVNVESA